MFLTEKLKKKRKKSEHLIAVLRVLSALFCLAQRPAMFNMAASLSATVHEGRKKRNLLLMVYSQT